MKLSAALVLVLGTQLVYADEIDPNKAAAQRYVELARTLKGQGKLAEACAQFEVAYKAGGGGGVLSELASCYRDLSTQLVAAKQDTSTVCTRIAADASVTPSPEAQTVVAACHNARADVLIGAKDWTAACEAAEAAVTAEDTAPNIVFAAGCYRDAGKLGHAWRRLLDAKARLARSPDGEVDRLVVELLSALRPGRVIVELKQEATVHVDGAAITRQGISIAGIPAEKDVQGTIGYPLDAGPHEIAVTVTGKPSIKQAITIVDGALQRVAIDLPDALSPPPRELQAVPKGGRKRAGWITIAAAGAVGVVGLYFGYDAFSKQGEANDLCPTRTNCSREAIDLNDDANRSANVSNALVAAGLIGATIGTVLVLTAPKETHVSVSPTPGGGGITLSRRF